LNLFDYPILVLPVSLFIFWFSAALGARFRRKNRISDERNVDDLKLVLGGTLTLLGLIIGFTFSMAVSRYDQRKNLEEEEANAIGTQYARASLLPSSDAAKVRALLKTYLDERIEHYRTRSERQRRQIDAETAQTQAGMWSAIEAAAEVQPTAVVALSVSGMNDVSNSQGYTQAAWWNRIPLSAWILMTLIAIFCNLLIGYGAYGRAPAVLLILPIALSISLSLIADIESPRGGLIRVHPQNLENLAQMLRSE
jgi:hypothetical protein